MRHVKVWLTFQALAVVFLIVIPAWGVEPNLSPTGRWRTFDDHTGKARSIIQIWEQGGKLYGKIDKLVQEPNEPPHPLCTKCDGDRQDKPILGMTILWDLQKDGDHWSGGHVLDPSLGKSYKCKVALDDGGKKLKVHGFIGFSLLGRTQVWVREP